MSLRLVPSLPPLAVVGRLEVPARALEHYYVVEAHACASILTDGRERIVGTTNEPGKEHLELYGWAPCVQPHIDDFGWTYIMPLRFQLSRVSARLKGCAVSLWLRRGEIYRLDDRVVHWTSDSGPACAMWVGIFKRPADRHAVEMMREGLRLLARGSRAAPRVKMGFRCPAAWECWVDTPQGRDLVPLAEAKRRGLLIATCVECDKPAYSVDRLFPYHHEMNRCRQHFREEGKAA